MDVVDPEGPAQQLGAVQVVHGQDCRELVLVADEGETPALGSLQVPDEVHVDDLSVLGKHADHVALRQAVVQAAHEHPSRVLVLVVPRRAGPGESHRQLPVVHPVEVLHVGQRIHFASADTSGGNKKFTTATTTRFIDQFNNK